MPTVHTEQHPLADEYVVLNDKAACPRGIVVPGAILHVIGWWDVLTGDSWMFAEGNMAALQYAMRSGLGHLPLDNEVVYGHIGPFGHLVHVSELGEVITEEEARRRVEERAG